MCGDLETAVTFDGATARLSGKVHRPVAGVARRALVVAHGRNGDMEEPLVAGLAHRASELGLWTLRFNFAFVDAGGEPSADTSDEIADLREAITFARQASGVQEVTVAGRGLGAWATVACATDEDAEDAILLGIAYSGQEERMMALERLGEFEIPTLIFVGGKSDRLDLPALEAIVDPMPFVQLVIVEGADHRLNDAKGEPMLNAVLERCDRWIRGRLEVGEAPPER